MCELVSRVPRQFSGSTKGQPFPAVPLWYRWHAAQHIWTLLVYYVEQLVTPLFGFGCAG